MVLDVNMGVPLTDEPELLKKAIKLVQSLTDLPICIDSSVVEAIEAGLSVYEGRALVNSVTAEDDRMAEILPMVKQLRRRGHRAAQRRTTRSRWRPTSGSSLTKKILDTAVDTYGLAVEDIVIDPLAMPIGADPNIVNVALRDDPPDPRRVRREHDAGRVQRLVRHARTGTRSAPRSCRWR